MFALEMKNVLTRLKIFTTFIRFLKNNCTINSILSIFTHISSPFRHLCLLHFSHPLSTRYKIRKHKLTVKKNRLNRVVVFVTVVVVLGARMGRRQLSI